MNKYPYKELLLIKPTIDDKVMDFIIELNHLRKKELGGSTPARIFFQLKKLFHIMESIGSARIEGNHTSIIDYIDSKSEKRKSKTEGVKEIQNVEDTLAFIDENAKKGALKIDENFIKEVHKRVVSGLSIREEGDKTPGEYRTLPIGIENSRHDPPPPRDVSYYMEELLDFMNNSDPQKFDLLKIALTHHRFVWIHPFGNGNGRTVRLLTYAQLIHAGFNISDYGRIVNPTAIFCTDRNEYYNFLSEADEGTREGLFGWCEYVLKGLSVEISKIDKLTDYSYLKPTILLPAIKYSLDRKFITDLEAEAFKIAIENKGEFNAGSLKDIFPDKLPAHVSRFIANMKEKDLIFPESKRGRKYLVNFTHQYLMRGVIEMLDKNGFLPIKNEV